MRRAADAQRRALSRRADQGHAEGRDVCRAGRRAQLLAELEVIAEHSQRRCVVFQALLAGVEGAGVVEHEARAAGGAGLCQQGAQAAELGIPQLGAAAAAQASGHVFPAAAVR